MIVGLGNPGPKYSQTRHNAGFWFLDALHRAIPQTTPEAGFRLQSRVSAEVCRVRAYGRDCLFARPAVFMNHSGQAVRALLDYYGVAVGDLLIAYDDLDLPPGTARLRAGGGHGGHNGMRDVFRHVDNTDFLRLRIGIGHPGCKDAVTGYVLGRPSAAEERLMLDSIAAAVAVMPDLLAGDLAKATRELHTGDRPAVAD